MDQEKNLSQNNWGKNQGQDPKNDRGEMNSGNYGTDSGMERRGMYEAPYSGRQARASEGSESGDAFEDDIMSSRDSRYYERNETDDEEDML